MQATMDAVLGAQLPAAERKALRLVTRSGNPSDPAALEQVAAAAARRVILLRPSLGIRGQPLDPQVRMACCWFRLVRWLARLLVCLVCRQSESEDGHLAHLYLLPSEP